MQEDIVEECRKHGIVVTAYSPLGSDKAPLLENEVVKKIAEKHNVSPSNVLISLHANRPGVGIGTGIPAGIRTVTRTHTRTKPVPVDPRVTAVTGMGA